MTMTEKEHHGQHAGHCGKCNAWRWEQQAAKTNDPNRVVEPEEGWDWQRTDTATEADAEFAARVLERCFKGSQAAFNAGFATPGSLSVTNFLIGCILGAQRPDWAKRLRGGLEIGSAKATGMPAEHFEKQIREMMDELQTILREEDGA